ncbi:hypothetical protein ACQ4M4_27015 [Leptolyngbya sp. AN02str]|uniref:hypothetical protein n=1 Tax=Leptolyngbya sp. AN02str TaxID=3423363 RepID=UPI003D31B65F
MSTFVTTIATATARLQTNSNVIQRWIREGHIPTVETPDSIMIPLEPFEQICCELEEWVADEDANERPVSVQNMEDF